MLTEGNRKLFNCLCHILSLLNEAEKKARGTVERL
jgi:hypothetical protein